MFFYNDPDEQQGEQTQTAGSGGSFLLEDSSALLLEDGFAFLLED